MFVLPDALAPLGAFPQFILYRLAPGAKPGKLDKLPFDWRSGNSANAHSPLIWLTHAEAGAYAAAWGGDSGVGFVITDTDPFWFLDIDNCFDGTNWSPIAHELLRRFAGAAVEVSVSGTGLHIIGQGKAPPHKTKRAGLAFDLYTGGRFVALTGTHASGNAATDHTAALAALVADYGLQPDNDATGRPAEWTTTPAAEWRGPEDDARLIERALRSQSAAGAFGGKASFADLWRANVDVLSRVYPDDHGDRPYDASAADAGLAQHLAFWTGKNCERMRTLMLQSALAREKWSREDYLPRTIMGAIARQRDVFQERLPVVSAIPAPPPDGPPQAAPVSQDRFLTPAAQVELFKGCVYVSSAHRVLVPGGALLKPDQFRVHFGGYSFPMDPANQRVSRNAWEAFTESQCFRSPRADSTCFRPERRPGELIQEEGQTLVNLWTPIETLCTPGDAGPFIRHVAKLLPDERDRTILLSYLAAIVQFPGRKFQWAPLVQGVQGNGKTLLTTAVARAVGNRYTHPPNAQELGSGGTKFTAWLLGKIFIPIEEIHTDERLDMLEALKPLITNLRIEIQAKGQDQVVGDNRANFVALSNYKTAIPKTKDDRRWAIFFTAQQDFKDLARDGMTGDYFPDLYDWFEGRGAYGVPGYGYVTHWLRSYPIADEFNPASKCHRAPETSSTREAVEVSQGSVEQEIMEAIESGETGFAGGWVSSLYLDKLLKRIGAERKISIRRRREVMRDLGYDWHPALIGGRVPGVVSPDGTKSRLYLKAGHLALNEADPRRIAQMYEHAQQSAMAAAAKFGT